MVAPHSSAERTEQQVLSLGSWFHNLHLPDGVQTAPQHTLGDFPDWKWQQFADHLPGDMNGWTALDVGCNAGFYSFELAKRGASVFAIDHDEHYLKQARWAAERLGLAGRVRFKRMQVYDLARLSRRFDLVLFMGVFYHLRYPLLALDLVAEKVQRLMVFQTLTMPGAEEGQTPVDLDMEAREQMLSPGWPKMAFIEHRLAHDPTNWWAPSAGCVRAMLRSTGLVVKESPAHEIFICEPAVGGVGGARGWKYDELAAAVHLGRRSVGQLPFSPR